jgi:hypothetical protein
MTNGLYLMSDGMVMVDYGRKKIPISLAQYRANGYRPPFDRLVREDKARTPAAYEARVEHRSARLRVKTQSVGRSEAHVPCRSRLRTQSAKERAVPEQLAQAASRGEEAGMPGNRPPAMLTALGHQEIAIECSVRQPIRLGGPSLSNDIGGYAVTSPQSEPRRLAGRSKWRSSTTSSRRAPPSLRSIQ